MDGLEEDPSYIAHFDHGPHGTSGGITKVGADELVSTKGKGGAVLYMWADSLEEAMQVGCFPLVPDILIILLTSI
jgi:hypothetical protein